MHKKQSKPEMGNAPHAFSPNHGIMVDQQVAHYKALDRVANAGGKGPFRNPEHYKKAAHFPEAKPIAK